MTGLALHRLVSSINMASADFCQPIPAPLDAGSTRQIDRSPRVRRATFTLILAAFTMVLSVQVSGFEDICLLTQYGRLICDFCSSGQCFACGFLQIPPRDGHPCRPANRSPCRAGRGLAPPSHQTATTAAEIASIKRNTPCLAHKQEELQDLTCNPLKLLVRPARFERAAYGFEVRISGLAGIPRGIQ